MGRRTSDVNVSRLLVCVFSFLLTAPMLLDATQYYVDFADGNDGNSGKTTSSAFMHCPGDPNATSLSRSTVLAPGDEVFFKGGVTYIGRIVPSSSGTITNPIAYNGNKNGSWGSGKSIIDLNYGEYFAFQMSGIDNIAISNFDIRKGKRPTSNEGGYINNTSGDHLVISNCVFSKSEGWDVLCPEGSDSSVYPAQTAIALKQADDVKIQGCEFYAFGSDLIYLFRATNVDVSGCNFGGINRGNESGWFSVAFRITYNSHGIRIHDSTFHDGWQYEGDDPVQRCHAGDWIHIYGNSTSHEYPNDIIIERCFFYNSKQFSYRHGTAFSYAEEACYDITYRNCLFINPHAGNGSILIQDANQIYIYNNTFISYDAVDDGAICMKIGAGAGNDCKVKNNIFIQYTEHSQAILEIYDVAWAGEINYNAYYRPDDATSICRRGSTWYSLSKWQALGFDSKSSIGNPNLVNVPSNPQLIAQGEYGLTMESVNEIGKGVLLAGFDDDYYGMQRSGTTWDKGAIAYAGGKVVLPPTNLRIKP